MAEPVPSIVAAVPSSVVPVPETTNVPPATPATIPETVPLGDLTVHLPPGKPMYYYSQIEYFYSHNIIPGIQFVIDDEDGPTQDQENPEPTEARTESIGGQTTGLYGYFEKALDRVVPPRMKNILSFTPQPGDSQPDPMQLEPNEVESDSPRFVDEEIKDDSDYESDNDTSVSDQSVEEPDETEPTGKKVPENADAIRSKFKGTKLDYFYRRNKSVWV